MCSPNLTYHKISHLDKVLQVTARAELCDYPYPVLVLHDIYNVRTWLERLCWYTEQGESKRSHSTHDTAPEYTHLESVYESHDLRPVLQLPEGVDL